jgi:hypothetical protein
MEAFNSLLLSHATSLTYLTHTCNNIIKSSTNNIATIMTNTAINIMGRTQVGDKPFGPREVTSAEAPGQDGQGSRDNYDDQGASDGRHDHAGHVQHSEAEEERQAGADLSEGPKAKREKAYGLKLRAHRVRALGPGLNPTTSANRTPGLFLFVFLSSYVMHRCLTSTHFFSLFSSATIQLQKNRFVRSRHP